MTLWVECVFVFVDKQVLALVMRMRKEETQWDCCMLQPCAWPIFSLMTPTSATLSWTKLYVSLPLMVSVLDI
jgi:hypothetical protein